MNKLAHTVDEACDLLSIGRTLFYSEVKAGRIETARAGGRTIVPRSSLERYIEARLQEARATA